MHITNSNFDRQYVSSGLIRCCRDVGRTSHLPANLSVFCFWAFLARSRCRAMALVTSFRFSEKVPVVHARWSWIEPKTPKNRKRRGWRGDEKFSRHHGSIGSILMKLVVDQSCCDMRAFALHKMRSFIIVFCLLKDWLLSS